MKPVRSVGVLSGMLMVAISLHSPRPCAAQTPDPFPTYATDACSSHPWLIPFKESSADLDDFARKRIDALVKAWRVDGGPVLQSGRVDGTEESRYPDLAGRRLRTVTKALEERGIPPEALWARDDGGSRGFTDNEPGVSEPQNRIVLATLPRTGERCARTLVENRLGWLRRNCSMSEPKAGKVACDNAMARLDETLLP